MPDPTLIADEEHNYSVQIPKVTPTGQSVEILEDQRDGVHRVHAHSPDLSELYFEIVSYPAQIDHDEAVAEQKGFLSRQSPDAAITATRRCAVGTSDATEFRFEGTLQGRWKVRRFVFMSTPNRTYRVIYDPTSAVNERVLESLVVAPARVGT